jgi:effector-binding domain-containing protein
MMASIMNMKAMVVAYLPMTGAYDQMPAAFDRLYTWIEQHGLKATGAPIAAFFNIPSDPDAADARWELLAALSNDPPEAEPDDSGIGVKKVEDMKVVSAVHIGTYDSVLPTYQALWAWMEDHGYDLDGPPMERYLTGPEVPADRHRTEILMPIRPV